jgi:O-antigen ligase
MTAGQSNASLISRAIAFLLPLVLAAYWPLFGAGHAVHAGVIVIRLTVLGGVAILALLWISGTITPMELRWTFILAVWLCVLLVPSLLGEHVSRGIHNWVRVLPVYCVAVLLARPLRHKPTRQAFGVGLGVAGVISFLFIVAIYLRYAGLSIPTYEHIRVFKTVVLHASGVALNPLASATLIFCVLSLSLIRSGWLHCAFAVTIAILGSAFTGSRAPLALAFAAGAALCITNLLHKRTIAARTIAVALVCSCLFLGGIVGSVYVTPERLSAVTEGRYDLWTVGIEKFVEKPLIGYGAESWRDDLVSRLPGYYKGSTGLTTLRAGGYHSEFVTLLAEGGLLCFIPATIILWLLFRACCRIAFHPSTPRVNGQALIFTFFLFVLRAAVEVPGIFGYGEDVTDYLAAIFIAIVVSQASLLRKRDAAVRHSLPIPWPPSHVMEQSA